MPNATAAGLALRALPDALPVPDSANVVGDPAALLTKLMLPLALPAAVGANSTEKLVLWFAGSVSGIDNPDMLNAAPERFAAVIARDVFPVFVNVTFCAELPPTDTLPNVSGLGETDRPAVVPTPESATETVPSVALLVICNVALRLPPCCGANWT